MFEKLFDNNFFITFERAQKLGGCPVKRSIHPYFSVKNEIKLSEI